MEVGCNYWIEQHYRHSIVFSRTRTEPSIVSANYYTSQIFIILSNQNSMRTDLISYSAFLRDLHSEYPRKWFISKNVDTEIRTQINCIVFTTVLLLRRTPASSSSWCYLVAPVYHSLSCQHFISFQRTLIFWKIQDPPPPRLNIRFCGYYRNRTCVSSASIPRIGLRSMDRFLSRAALPTKLNNHIKKPFQPNRKLE